MEVINIEQDPGLFTIVEELASVELKLNNIDNVDRIRGWRNKNVLKSIISNCKIRARSKGQKCDITEEFLEQLRIRQNNKCVYSGIEFSEEMKHDKISIDRIDSNKGYTKDNVQLVTKAVNYMKQEYSEAMFLHLCRKIVDNCKI
jgi:hypothetical protein